jgi:hypothetical protein
MRQIRKRKSKNIVITYTTIGVRNETGISLPKLWKLN